MHSFVYFFFFLLFTHGQANEEGSPIEIPSPSLAPVIDTIPPPRLPPSPHLPPPPAPIITPIVKPVSCFDTICGCADWDVNIPPFTFHDDLFLGYGRRLKAIDIVDSIAKSIPSMESSFVKDELTDAGNHVLENEGIMHIPSPSLAPVIDSPPPLPPPSIVTPIVKPISCFDSICRCADGNFDISPGLDADFFIGKGRILRAKELKKKSSTKKPSALLELAMEMRNNMNTRTPNTRAKPIPEFYPYTGPPVRPFPLRYPGPYPYPYRPPFPPVVAERKCASCQAYAREKARDLALDDLLIRQTIEIRRKRLRERERAREAAERNAKNAAAIVE